MAKSRIKLKIDIVEDHRYDGAGLGKKYQVNKLVFDRKTGRTIDHGTYGGGWTYKEALALKARVKHAFYA